MHDCDCDHIIGLSTVPDCGGLIRRIEITSGEFFEETRELFAFADKFLKPEARRRPDESHKMTDADIFERYIVKFRYCPNCGERITPDIATEVRPFIKVGGPPLPPPAIICRRSADRENEASPNPRRSTKGITADGVPYAITVEYRAGAAPDADPIRILGRFEIDDDYAHFFVDPHPDGGFACYVERPFAIHGDKNAVLDAIANSPWMCVPEAIREASRKAIDAVE